MRTASSLKKLERPGGHGRCCLSGRHITLKPMNKLDLARQLARESHRSSGQAADDVDTLVYKILKNLKETSNKAVPASQQRTLAARKVKP